MGGKMNILHRLRWLLGLYNKEGVKPMTFEAFTEAEKLNEMAYWDDINAQVNDRDIEEGTNEEALHNKV
jgi:hypothetical protein